MAGKLADLVVELRATSERFTADLRAAENAARVAGDRIERSFGQRIRTGISGLVAPLRSVQAAFAAVGVAAAAITFQRIVQNALDLGDRLQDVSAQLGVGVERLQAWQFAAVQAGVGSEQLSQALRKFTVTVGQAAAGSAQAQKALEAVGIGLDDLRRLSNEELFGRAAAGIAAIGDVSARNAAQVRLFGREGAKLGPLFAGGAEGLAQFEEAARKAGAVLSTETVRRLAEANDKFEAMAIVIKTQLAEAIVSISPALLGFSEALGAAARFAGSFNLLGTEVQGLAADLRDVNEALANIRRARERAPSNVGFLETEKKLLKEQADLLARINTFRVAPGAAGGPDAGRNVVTVAGKAQKIVDITGGKAQDELLRSLDQIDAAQEQLAEAERRRIEQRAALLNQVESKQIQALTASALKADKVRGIELEIARAKREQLEATEQIRRIVSDPADAAAALKAVQESTAADVKVLEDKLGEASKSTLVVHFQNALDEVHDSFSNVVDQMIAEGRVDFENLGRALGQSLLKGLIDAFVISPVIKALKEQVGAIDAGQSLRSGLSGLAGLLSSIPLFFASGGIVTRPTLGVVGESGPEAVIPLNRANSLGGDVQVTIINASQEPVAARRGRGAGGSREIRIGIGASAAEDLARGGTLAKALEQRYGLSPHGVSR